MKDDKGKRKVSAASVYNHWMKRVQEKHGPFVNEGKPWTNEDIDFLLESYLKGTPYDAEAGVRCMANNLWRSRESIKCKLYKLSVRHPQSGGDEYEPKNRTWTTPLHSDNEKAMCLLEAAVSGEGRRHRAHEAPYIAKILNRSPEEIRQFLEKIRWGAPLIVKGRILEESMDDWNARICDEVFRKAPHAIDAALR